MATISLIDKIESLIAPTILAMGYELWHCDVHQSGRHSLLRIYIDSSSGITLDDCSRVSAQVGALLDVEDLIKNSYSLEVSSPGLDRHLFKFDHYEKYVGSKIKLQLLCSVDGKKKFVGTISAVSMDGILTLLVDDKEVAFAISDINKAQVIL